MSIERQAKELWHKTFKDKVKFIDEFFDLYYTPDTFFHTSDKGKLTCMLFATPYRLSLGENILSAAYICSVCTDEQYRSRGIAGRLIARTEEELKEKGFDAVFLMAADEGLVEYYKRFGYRSCGIEQSDVYDKKDMTSDCKGFELIQSKQFDMELFNKLARHRRNTTIHSEKTLALYRNSSYDIFFLAKGKDIMGLAVGYFHNDSLRLVDIVTDCNECLETFLQLLYIRFGKKIDYRTYPLDNDAKPQILHMIKPLREGIVHNEDFFYMSLLLEE